MVTSLNTNSLLRNYCQWRRMQPVSTHHGESRVSLGYLVPSQLKKGSGSFIIKKCQGLELQSAAVDRNWDVVLEFLGLNPGLNFFLPSV